jgi:Amt family ammonium transporter
MDYKVMLDTIWVLVAGFLVFFMNLGFATVESGFARSKNCVNILSKNFIVFAVSSLGFLLLGWGLMFGDGNGFIVLRVCSWPPARITHRRQATLIRCILLDILDGDTVLGKVSSSACLLRHRGDHSFRAVAERIKYISFIVFSFILTLLVYPTVGHWIWAAAF